MGTYLQRYSSPPPPTPNVPFSLRKMVVDMIRNIPLGFFLPDVPLLTNVFRKYNPVRCWDEVTEREVNKTPLEGSAGKRAINIVVRVGQRTYTRETVHSALNL